MSRKIRAVAALRGALYAMPESYDPEAVTLADASNDAELVAARAELVPLSAKSLDAAKAFVRGSAEGYPGAVAERRREVAEALRESLQRHWDAVLSAAWNGDAERVRAALARAQNISSTIGDDSAERAALAMFAT